ncbi:MAG: ATP-binding protein [Clostridia bacterium]|nr:ATP-binding protein [Clostridia bacterium]
MNPTDRYFETLRRTRQRERDLARENAYGTIPGLAALENERRSLFREAALGKRPLAGTADAIRALGDRERALLSENGMAPDALEPRYDCALCKDTGWTDGGRRKPCRCRLLYEAEHDPAIGITGKETFETFSDTIQPTEEQRAQAKRAMNLCLRYADSLPHPEKTGLLLLGKSGLGKSFLGNAIARRALERGVPARRVTASEFIRLTMQHLSERTTDETFRTVPLLVLDDLGTEPLIPNVSEETLFALYETRITRGLCTVSITNLAGSELQERYGERLVSRLVDTETTMTLRLTGDNLRWRKNKC